jgi:uncharacterized membrane protein
MYSTAKAPVIFALGIAAFFWVLPFASAETAGEESIEIVEVQDVSDSAGSPLSFLQIVGRNHAAAVHLPIGLLVALFLIEAFHVASPKKQLHQCGFILCIAAAVSFLPALVTGMLRSGELFAGQDAPHIFLEHRNLMVFSFAVLLLSLVLRIVKKNALVGKIRIVYLLLLAISLVSAVSGAHHGGMLVYGENFLPY